MAEREIELGDANLYEMNKTLIQQTSKVLSNSKISELKQNIVTPYLMEQKDQNNTYFMLLCHDERNYTLLNILNWEKDTIEKIVKELFELIDERGQLYSIAKTEDKVALEIWLSTENGVVCYYFFPYDQGVIEI